MSDTTAELLCCPFCNSRAECNGWAGSWYTRCTSEDCWASQHGSLFIEMEEAIAAWNRRSPSAEAEKLAEALLMAARQFEYYAKEHAAKANAATDRNALGDADIAMSKARTNTAYAETCRSALSAFESRKEGA